MPKGELKEKVDLLSAEVGSWSSLGSNAHNLGALPARPMLYKAGRSKSVHAETRKMVNYACVG